MVETEIAMRSTIWKKSTVKLSTRSWKIGARAEPGDGFGAVTERASAFAEERNLCTPASRSSLLCSRSDRGPRRHGFARTVHKIKGECNDFNRKRPRGAHRLSASAACLLLTGLSIGAAGSASATTYKKTLACEVTDTGGINDRSFNASAYWGSKRQ